MSNSLVDADMNFFTWNNPDQCRTTGCATKGCQSDPDSTCATSGADAFPGASGCNHSFESYEYLRSMWISAKKGSGYPTNAVITHVRDWNSNSGWSGMDLVLAANYKTLTTSPTNAGPIEAFIQFGTMNYASCRGTNMSSNSNGINGQNNVNNGNGDGKGYGLSGVIVHKGTCRIDGIAYRWHYVPNPLDTTHPPTYSFVGTWSDQSIKDKIVAGQVVGDADLKGEYATYYPELMTENPDGLPKRIYFVNDIKMAYSGTDGENGAAWPCTIRGVHRIISLTFVNSKCNAPTGQTCTDDGKYVDKKCVVACETGKKCVKGQCVDDTKDDGKDKDKDKKGTDGGSQTDSGSSDDKIAGLDKKVFIGLMAGLGWLLLLLVIIGGVIWYRSRSLSVPIPPISSMSSIS